MRTIMHRAALSVKSKAWLALLANVFFAVTLYILPSTLHAAFEDTGTGARAAALAGGYVAAGDDVLSLLYNPAGLATVDRKEVTSEYAKLFAGLSDGSNISQTFLAYGQPVKWGGTMAVSWKQFSLEGLYKERTLSLGYGEWITSKVAAGFALKQLHHEFTAPTMSVDDAGSVQNVAPSFFSQYGNSNTAYSADLGFLIKPLDRYTVGVSIQDFNEPNVALNPADHEVVSKTVRLGLAYDGPRDLKLMGGMTSHKGLAHSQDVTWTGAAEKWWSKKEDGAFATRGSLSTGSRDFTQVALGAAYNLHMFQIDYAFLFNIGGIGIGDTAGTHRFSLTYRFGRDRREMAEAAKKKAQAQEASRHASKTQRDPEIEALLDEGLPATNIPKAKRQKTTGPGLTNVQVQTTPVPSASVSPSDYEVPLTANTGTATTEKEIEPITRIQFIVRALSMSTEYLLRTAHGASADNRLSAVEPLFATLLGYVRGSDVEMTDLMSQTDQLEAARKEYGALVWEGASATDRLGSLVHTLESWFGSILRARHWNMQDARDVRYRNWLDQALSDHDRLIHSNTPVQSRLDSIRRIAGKALDFERQPSEPITPVAPVSTVPVMPVAPVVPETPAPVTPVPTPVVSTPTVIVPMPTVVTPAAVPEKAPTQVFVPKKTVVTKRATGSGGAGVPAIYKVKEGDTLINLAERFYGDYKRWREIYMLNQDRLGRGGNLTPGQLLIMPPKDKQN